MIELVAQEEIQEYLVKWVGYAHLYNSWEVLDALKSENFLDLPLRVSFIMLSILFLLKKKKKKKKSSFAFM